MPEERENEEEKEFYFKNLLCVCACVHVCMRECTFVHPHVFRCILASLYEAVFVRRSASPSVGPPNFEICQEKSRNTIVLAFGRQGGEGSGGRKGEGGRGEE